MNDINLQIFERLGSIDSRLNSIESHLKTLNGRVTKTEDLQRIMELKDAENAGKIKVVSAVSGSVWGIIASIIIGVASLFIQK